MLTDEQLSSLEQWAACDLRDVEGAEVQSLIDEVRSSRKTIDDYSLLMSERWVVTYRCRRCERPLRMETARSGDMVLINRAWCWRCDVYVTKSEAIAESHLVNNNRLVGAINEMPEWERAVKAASSPELLKLRELLKRACDELEVLGSKAAFRLRIEGDLDP